MNFSTNQKIPIISIITVVFNGASTLRSTIESIISQITAEIEYIIIDGGSTDGTNEIIEEYSKYLSCWISEADDGIYDAMNKGLELASGEFVWFINSGDLVADANVINDLKRAINQKVNYIYSGTHLIDTFGEIVKTTKNPEIIDASLLTKGMYISHQSFLARKSLAPKYDTNLRLVADQKWILNIISNSPSGALRFDRPISRYLLGGISEKQSISCIREKILLVKTEYPTYYNSNKIGYVLELTKHYTKALVNKTKTRILNSLTTRIYY